MIVEHALSPGLIFEIAAAAEIAVGSRRPKCPIRCPFHEDRHASAFLSEDNIFFCSVCTPNGGWSAKAFCEALKLDWHGFLPQPFTPQRRTQAEPTFTPTEAQRVWHAALKRMRDDNAVERDRDVWDYLERRRLTESFELGAFGILGAGMALPPSVANWVSGGYRIVAPLVDATGTIVNVQARTILPRQPKTLFPAGSKALGTTFACARGLEVLCGVHATRVLLAEGLTDHLALTITSPVPVLSAPGTSMAAAAIGPWVKDVELYVALDWDDAGTLALEGVAKRAYRFGAKAVRRIEWPAAAKDACQLVELRGITGLEDFLRRVLLAEAA